MKKTKSIVASLILGSTAFAAGSAPQVQPQIPKEALIQNLDFMRNVYHTQYAPAEWKKTFAGWDLDQELAKAKARVQAIDSITLKGYQKILKDFIGSMRDYHTSIRFLSTEKSSLPIDVKGVNGKFYIVNIDRDKLSEATFPYHMGDEVVTFGGSPTGDVVAQIKALSIPNTDRTDQALAEIALTARTAAKLMDCPQGPVTLGVRRAGAAEVTQTELFWDYTPESILPQFDPQPFESLAGPSELNPVPQLLSQNSPFQPMMIASEELGDENDPFSIGPKLSYIPALGTKIWEADPKAEFYAYIYRTPDRHLIGYVRIPSYDPKNTDSAAKEFAGVIAQFDQDTDALVIDEINNPGGSVAYLGALASMLATEPLATPLHKMTITQLNVSEAAGLVADLQKVTNDQDARKAFGSDTMEGYPVSYELAQGMLNFGKFIIGEWNAGRRITQPYFIEGVNKINPAPVHYSKPILVVTNALDFSGGDFFPAILQDNKRVKIFGERTAGAGGYVLDIQYPNLFGIDKFRVTGSIADRLEHHPIENLGITPDIPYDLTESDLQNGFADYARAINAAVIGLIQ